MKFLYQIVVTAVAVALTSTSARAAEAEVASKPFDARGVVVEIHTFFSTATRQQADVQLAHEEGVFAFLETPQNAAQLQPTEPGSVVHVRGKLLERGALLHIDNLQKITTVPLIDFARFRNDPGQQVTLKGVNKCQCGLAVADLPHSCELGHLHHLEADDGKIYHYLQFASGKDTFLGKDSHFQPVEVTARVLPGQYLLVERVTIK
jgi:hypothetical protein